MSAKLELLQHIKDRDVEYISIAAHRAYDDVPIYIKGTLHEVLPQLDFKYNNSYGCQEIFGYIWYADGTWSSRDEYDGAECWTHQVCPDRNVKLLN